MTLPPYLNIIDHYPQRIVRSVLLLATFFIIMDAPLLAQNKSRPKIGLTLSGGGAKGLAHIGLIKAIDSAGLKVDYVTGTSMGAVVGSLYAAGYSGDEILKIAEGVNWDIVLSNKPQFKSVNLLQKIDYSHYTVELPIVNGRPALNRGFLESNELWLTLSQLFYPYYKTNDFSKLQKGFQCIATDLLSGEMVVLDSGDIVKAVRASMAIPSVFTPVDFDGQALVDGGITRNFPVSNVREMGASIVIGSNVSATLTRPGKLTNPFQVLSQVAFYKESEDFKTQRPLVDFYVDYDLGNNTSASFGSSGEIIKIGLERGEELYPALKRMKDSLDAIYGVQQIKEPLNFPDSIRITQYEVKGLTPYERITFLGLLNFSPGKYYTAAQLNAAIREAIGTRYLRTVTYTLAPLWDGTAKIQFQVTKAPSDYLRLGLHYNTATGIAIKAGWIKRGVFDPFSILSVGLALGENPSGEAKYLHYIGRKKKMAVQAELTGHATDFITYDSSFERSGFYNQSAVKADLQLLHLLDGHWAWGFGTSFEKLNYKPKISVEQRARGTTNFFNTYFLLQQNTLDAPAFPVRGRQLSFQAGVIYDQNPDFTVLQDNKIVATEDSSFFSFEPYLQTKLSYQEYIPLHRNTLIIQLQTGVNFNSRQAFLNDFIIGGQNHAIRNQVVFAGLPDVSIFTNSAASLQLGYRVQIVNNLFVTGKANTLWYDFIDDDFRLHPSAHGMGYALTVGYNSIIGPIEASIMYSDINKRIKPYFNIGIPLGRN